MPMIPKDGRTYLAWHKIEGHLNVHWFKDHYVCMRLYQIGSHYEGLDNIERWMDEKGQWHEIEQ